MKSDLPSNILLQYSHNIGCLEINNCAAVQACWEPGIRIDNIIIAYNVSVELCWADGMSQVDTRTAAIAAC